jgi:hypothetical protein
MLSQNGKYLVFVSNRDYEQHLTHNMRPTRRDHRIASRDLMQQSVKQSNDANSINPSRHSLVEGLTTTHCKQLTIGKRLGENPCVGSAHKPGPGVVGLTAIAIVTALIWLGRCSVNKQGRGLASVTVFFSKTGSNRAKCKTRKNFRSEEYNRA